MKTGFILGFLISFCFGFGLNQVMQKNKNNELKKTIQLGVFSTSLNVKDLNISKSFYENIGFSVFVDKSKQNYVIMKNGNTLIGLFQGMFKNNILTFNPGWDENAKTLREYDDIRIIQKNILDNNIKLDIQINENTQGPGSIFLTDPDGNAILFDQHI